MSRARAVDESTRAKAVELRLKGYSYRKIASELGVSVSTVFRLVKSVGRTPKPVSAISINSEATEFGKILRGVALLTLLEIHNTKRVDEIEELIKWIKMTASLRLIGDFRCVWIDANGYCKAWILKEKKVNVIDNPLLCVACPLYTPLYILKRRS
ncbi:MAG: helix-turn-helix domain-containing protein [Desulfurococcales archaeon]|jgi:transposase-like protein|nr:helix-turn-helix domain-containing protein [Desulfurococcales archaeon]